MNRDSRQVLTEWLVLEAQGGSERAFRDLYELWRADLRRLALIRVERPAAADELANDVWLSIARDLRRLDDPACFPRWAFRIVERRCTDWIRARTLARKREIAAAAESERLAPADATAAGASDDVARLRELIARLPADQRQLVQLHYNLERSVGEIAEMLAVPTGTIKSRLFSVRQVLKQMLERKQP